MHERVRDPTCRRGSGTERKRRIRQPELGTGEEPQGLQRVTAG